MIKATAIDPSVVGDDGVYRHTGRARVFVSEAQAIKAIKQEEIKQGDIMVVIGGGPSGTGMEETYQLTSALKHISWGKTVSLITDARFSGCRRAPASATCRRKRWQAGRLASCATTTSLRLPWIA